MALSKTSTFLDLLLIVFTLLGLFPFCLLRDDVLEIVGRLATDGLMDIEIGSVAGETVRFAKTGVGLDVVGASLELVWSNICGSRCMGSKKQYWTWLVLGRLFLTIIPIIVS